MMNPILMSLLAFLIFLAIPLTVYLLFGPVPAARRRRLASNWRDFRPVAKAPARWMDAPAVTNVYRVQLPALGAAGAKQHRTANAGSGYSFGIQLTFPTRALRAQHIGRAGWQRIPDVESGPALSEVNGGGPVGMPVHLADDATHTEAPAIAPDNAVILPTHAEYRL
ncbi:hypothetical protein HMN09_01179300 [Mycena chlorophos]|uniref:Uncharacterized protein n=1 Tax=Mycena chlorophos TaxID=658473 RepID=A0A8H6VTY3_MYCCL|nr:hypothetical protein HMN09_01179300 [Mycena chlorophos]